jgi:hypothetical protein
MRAIIGQWPPEARVKPVMTAKRIVIFDDAGDEGVTAPPDAYPSTSGGGPTIWTPKRPTASSNAASEGDGGGVDPGGAGTPMSMNRRSKPPGAAIVMIRARSDVTACA